MPPFPPRPETAWKLDPEKVAYWYFRLNGFLQLENFVVHPRSHGGQRTDADLLAVRFPHRAERLHDDAGDIMIDDEAALGLSRDQVDVLIAEVKRGRCALNGPWTDPAAENVHRVLAAIGCLPRERIAIAANDIYERGVHESDLNLRIRLVCIGRRRCHTTAERYPEVKQLSWDKVLTFIWHRLHRFRHQKKQADQWDRTGRTLKSLVMQSQDVDTFIGICSRAMEEPDEGSCLRS